MRACVAAALAKAKVRNIANASATQVQAAVTSCDAKAKREFEKAGGSAAVYEAQKRGGAKDMAAKAMKACVDTAIDALTLKKGTNATAAHYANATIVCASKAMDKHKASGA